MLLQIPRRTGWSPARSEAQTLNEVCALTSEESRAHSSSGQDPVLDTDSEKSDEERHRVAAIRNAVGVVFVDGLYAAIAALPANGLARICSSFAPWSRVGSEVPANIQEAAAIHPLRVSREWATQVDQGTLRGIRIQGGNAPANHQIGARMRWARCGLSCPVASGVIAEIQSMRRFYLPARLGMEGSPAGAELAFRLCKHFRTVVSPHQGPGRREQLPRLPPTTDGLQAVIAERRLRDGQAAPHRLAGAGSSSAMITVQLERR